MIWWCNDIFKCREVAGFVGHHDGNTDEQSYRITSYHITSYISYQIRSRTT